DLRFDPAKARAKFPNGLGTFARPSDARGAVSPRIARGRTPAETVELVNAIQRWAMRDTRLGIPVWFHEESLHGYAALHATMFPQAIAMASAWDPGLVRRINAVIAREVRARGVQQVLSPVVDVARDPRWGRIEETFGEDPFLAGELGVAAVQGLQGEGRDGGALPDDKVFATLKHLTGHGQPESGTNVGPSPISERTLRENFFPPFEQVVKRTGIAAVMPSYNEIDGVPSHANRWLLGDVLRGEWGFKGALVSDYFAIAQLVSIHHVEPDLASAAIRALTAGVDADLPDGESYATLVDSVRAGRVDEALVNGALRRLLELKFRAGLFERPYADARRAEAVTGNAEAAQVALEAARKSIVLLKNDGVLPLDAKSGKTFAVIGPNAAVARLGGYSNEPRHAVSPLDGIRAKGVKVVTAQGVAITENDDWWADDVKLADPAKNRELIAQAVEVARGADTIVLAIGDTEQTSREGWAENHLGDRDTLDLVGEQNELADALFALGKPVVVVLINGRPLSAVNVAAKANALVEAWYLGQEGGTALADALFGDVNPGGKLPVTIARSVGQLPVFYNAKPSARRGYLFDTTEPLFPFGWGLSYSTFTIGAPRVSPAEIRKDGTATISVEVRNTGQRAGDEVVQLYVHDKVSSVTRPTKELKGFQRVTLAPGERKTLTFTLGLEALRFWNAQMQRVVEPGEFEIMAGPNSVDLKTATLTVVE
ncbi:MAG TPA: glycoside hydrolase family 3 N-terminal domain-containing protein, partial [Gammaproteobacteria bacterium]|nr:glycoside hydrolase family 3 N-terminal domain-containing protein [Gammaproteobacteria bacterium]